MVQMQSMVFAPQEEGNWCWAAVAEMLAVNAAGGQQTAQTSQCHIVNQVLMKGSDPAKPQSAYCCLNENACNVQGTVPAGLNALGYGVSLRGPLFLGFG